MAQLLSEHLPSLLAGRAENCPGCGQPDVTVFLELTGVPVFNNVLWPDRTTALSAPTGDISLAVCPSCGLVRNTSFDPAKVRYSPAYENSLHGSSTFVTWAHDLAGRLTTVHDLPGGHVVEVGAGSGEFLSLLCDVAGCTGVGYDPSHDSQDRRGAGARSHVDAATLPDTRAEEADLVICRHVLEHVADPVALLTDIAGAVVPRPGRRLPIYVEVPDAAYMLNHGAFWDVIYEHPLYFDIHALRATFAAAGYEGMRTGQTFGGQFAWIEGYTGGGGAMPSLDGRVVAGLLGSADAFGYRFRNRIHAHAERLQQALRTGQVAVWGAGSKGVSFCNLVPTAADALVIDVNPRKLGKHLPGTGQPVLAPEDLRDQDIALVVVMNQLYVTEIRRELQTLGVRAEVIVG